jgi:hypothetical protein
VPAVTVKFAGLVAVPEGVVRVTLPVVAPPGTVALTWLTVMNANVAVVPLNRTDVTPVKLVPKIAMDVPTPPAFGDRLLILGVTENEAALVTVPADVVTEILPLVAPAGTVALILVALATVNTAPVPLNLTELALENPIPSIATAVPTLPLFGEKPVMVRPAPVTVKLMGLVPVPAGVVTVIRPEVAPAGTVVWMFPGPMTVNGVANVPLNRTAVAPMKFAP